MNKKLKLLTLLSTITTSALEPIGNANTPSTSDEKENYFSQKFNSNLLSPTSSGGSYDYVTGQNPITHYDTNPFIGHVKSNFDNPSETTYDNAGYTSVQNEDYLIVPYWNIATSKAHYNTFTSYSINRETKVLTLISEKINLGYDVSESVLLKPHIIGENLITFSRLWNTDHQYGTGEWTVGVTNIKSGSFSTFNLNDALGGISTANFRNIHLTTIPGDNLKVYLSVFDYLDDNNANLRVWELTNFDVLNQFWHKTEINNVNVSSSEPGWYPGTRDLVFGDGFATPKHEYLNKGGKEYPLLGWTNLFDKGDIKPIKVDFEPLPYARGYWLFKTTDGLVFVNLGDDGGDDAKLQIGFVDSDNNATISNVLKFPKDNPQFDFYGGVNVTLNFFRGFNETYYMIPNGIKKDDAFSASQLPNRTNYFAFNVVNKDVTNLSYYNWNTEGYLFKKSNQFTNWKLNYVVTTGVEMVVNSHNLDNFKQERFQTFQAAILDKFSSFLTQNLFFIDLTDVYNNDATTEQKKSIEKVAEWIGKKGDYTFAPMTISELESAAKSNLPESVDIQEYFTTINNFISIQKYAAKKIIADTYVKWISTIEETTTGHQWGWYNENNLKNMFPAYILSGSNGLFYVLDDNDVTNPLQGLQKAIDEWRNELRSGTPTRFLEKYLNPAPSSDIENTLNEYRDWGKNQLSWYYQKIKNEFSTFYYGFKDTNAQFDEYWNLFIDQTNRNNFDNVDKLISSWIEIMKQSKYDQTTVFNFLYNARTWNSMDVSSWAGKDAKNENFTFDYTTEFEHFKGINTLSFDAVVNDFYDTFLKQNFLGYPDSATQSTYDVSQFFRGSSEIITRSEFIAKFSHDASFYNYFNSFYTWIASESKYSVSRNQHFSDFAKLQYTSLQNDFETIVSFLEQYYYGFKSSIQNKLTNDILGNLNIGDQISATILIQNFKDNPPLSELDFPGIWATKTFLEQFKKEDNENFVTWKDDQLTQLTNKIESIVSQVKNDYYGWISKSGETRTISKIDELLTNYSENLELSSSNIISTINKSSLPTGITSLHQIQALLEAINEQEIQKFKDNQNSNITLEFTRILTPIISEYYGFAFSDSLSNNVILKFILAGHSPNTSIDIAKLVLNFKTEVVAKKTDFPVMHATASFLSQIIDQGKELANDQVAHFNTFVGTMISNLIWGYFGYNPSSSLSNNFFAKTLFEGHVIGSQIDKSVMLQKFKDSIENRLPGYPEKYLTSQFIDNLTANGGDVENFIFDQSIQLNNDFEKIVNLISNSWYGFSATGTMTDNYIYKYFLAGQNLDEELDASTLLEYFKNNFLTNDINIAGQWEVKTFIGQITEDSQAIKDFIKDQNDNLQTIWTSVLNKIQRNYYGYISETTSLITKTILSGVTDGEKLDISTLFTNFKGNVVAKQGIDNFPLQYELNKWFSNLDEIASQDMNDFIDEQNNKLEDNVNTIINDIITSYWGYGSSDVPKSILDGFFQNDEKTPLSSNDAIDKIIQSETRDGEESAYHIYTYLKGIIDGDLNVFMGKQIESAKLDLINILSLLKNFYFGYEIDFSSGTEVFVGAKHIALFFSHDGNFTNDLPGTVDELYNLFKTQLLQSDIIINDGKDYSTVSSYLKSLFSKNGDVVEPLGELLNYKIWSETQKANTIDTILQNYFDNYYGYATGNDLNNLTTWFGPQGTSMLSLDELKANMLAHIQTLPPASINAALDEFSLLLGTSNDQPTDDSILARDLKSALEQINTISQSWRNNYYGISGYTGLWFEYQYDISNHNWSDANNRTDLNAVRNAATIDSNKFLTEYTKLFIDGSTNLINFKSFQDSEMTKILQPIVDFYNQWYMGYFVTDTNKLESNNPTITNGWVYSEVLGEISSTITKNKDTTEWESQYINATYVSSTTKTNNYRDEQMNKLVSDINDNFIGDFLKKNYFGYNSGTSIPSSVQTILNWQNSANPEAIWDMATWSGNDWTTTTASTYKIFIALDSNHITDLAAGKHFNAKLSEYSDSTAGKYGAEFINFQNKALNEEVTKLIPQYQAVYFGYTSKNDVNNSFLPGIVEMTNGNLNWVLADSISALVADPGNFQNADRVTNGKWLHNGALEKITRNLSQDDNFTAKERNAFEDDVTKIINEYKVIFRGFINDVNGNKLSFKTLGGDNALDNGVFVRTSSDVTSAIFNQTAFINYVHTFHNSSTTPTWEANIVTDYRGNENKFKDEQTNVYRSYLEEVNKKYSAVSQGYFATFNGSTLSFPNLPGWVTGPTGATIDINVAMGVLDRETYNQMITPDSSATYRLSYNAWKFYEDNIQNFTQEQANLSSKDLAASEKGFKRQTEIFNFLAESESNKSWKTEANYRGNYQNFSESKQALSNFLNQSGNPTSVADLNEISSQWFSLTQGDESTDWNNTALKHTFLFFSQYGMPLQLIYEPTNPKLLKSAKISATIVELGSGQHLLNGDVDSLTFSPSSQNGNVSYGATLIITKGFQQFTYKIISANNKFPFDQLLFTVADTSSGTPTYNLAQKITIAKNLDTPNSTENSTAAIEYDKGTFDFANESPDYDGTSSLPMPAQQGINTITSISELHHTTKAVRDIYIQIGVGYDLSSGRKIRTNISIMSPDYNNQVLSIDEVISRLPHIVPPSETSSLPSWVIPVIIAVASVTVIAPTMFFTIRKIRSRSQTGKTLKKHVELKNKQQLLKNHQTKAKRKDAASFLFKSKKK